MELETNYNETVSDSKFFDKYQAKKDKLKKLMKEWEQIQESLEEFS